MPIIEILKKPHLTAKSAHLGKQNKFCFIVNRKANKVELKKAINKLYAVNVEQVNTMRYAGKPIQRHTKKGLISGKRANYKKAIITLAKGETIDTHNEAV